MRSADPVVKLLAAGICNHIPAAEQRLGGALLSRGSRSVPRGDKPQDAIDPLAAIAGVNMQRSSRTCVSLAPQKDVQMWERFVCNAADKTLLGICSAGWIYFLARKERL